MANLGTVMNKSVAHQFNDRKSNGIHKMTNSRQTAHSPAVSDILYYQKHTLYYSLILITDIYYKRNVKCVYSISLCNCVTPVALYANVQEFDVT